MVSAPHRRSVLRISTHLVAGVLALLAASAFSQPVPPQQLSGLKWRNIGPFRGGRVSAVGGCTAQPNLFYMGLPRGGVWKTTSAGQTWYPVFDSVKGGSSVGSVAIAPSDPNTVYAGTGEISGGGQGNGLYKSADAGSTWSLVGLADSKQIPTILVDPHHASLVLAAAAGNGFEKSPNLGVYRSTDGGKTWKVTLTPPGNAGIQHLAWAYDNPSVILATTRVGFQFAPPPPPGAKPDNKKPATPEIYKSTDEGVTWKKVGGIGLPELSGRITTAIAQGTHSQRMYLIGTFGLYRSDDGGEHWHQMAGDDPRIANGQGEYSSGVYVDSQNPDLIYTLATCVYRSLDGGKTFAGFKGAPGGDDPQQMWINPENGQQMLLGGDQGAVVSHDAGKTWGSWYNQSTAQVYHISTDNQFPYWVYATQQDSGSIATSSRGNLGAITPFDWSTHPGNEGGYIIPDPLDSKISYAVGPVGGIIRVSQPSGQWTQIEPNMSPDTKLRGFNGEMAFSPSNPHEMLMSFQYLLSTTDGGRHWKPLSGDLTADPDAKTPEEKQRAQYTGISTFSASPLSPGLIWVATGNGFVYVTKDHGQHWENLNNGPLTSRKQLAIGQIVASSSNKAEAYLLTRGGSKPKSTIYRTVDFGQTWQMIATKLPEGVNSLNGIRPDTQKSGLLFGFSGFDVAVSTDDGETWQSLNLNLPPTSFSDLTIHGNDLVLGTFGRGIWILDDITPLRQYQASVATEVVHLYKPAQAYRLLRNTNDDTPFPPEVPHAENPPLGAVIYYTLQQKPSAPIRLEIADSRGQIIRHYSSEPIGPYDDPAPLVPEYWREIPKPLPDGIGLNRFNWNGRYDTPRAFNHDLSDAMSAMPGDTPAAIEGPLAPPGTYTVRLYVDGKILTQTFVWKNDPRSIASPRDIEGNHSYRLNLYAAIEECYSGYELAASLRTEVVKLRASKLSPELEKEAKALEEKLAALGGTATHVRKFYGPPQPDSFVGLNGYLLARLDAFNDGDESPTDSMMETWGSDWSKLKAVLERWSTVLKKDVPQLNAKLQKAGQSPLTVSTKGLAVPAAPAKKYLPPPLPAGTATTSAVAVPIG